MLPAIHSLPQLGKRIQFGSGPRENPLIESSLDENIATCTNRSVQPKTLIFLGDRWLSSYP